MNIQNLVKKYEDRAVVDAVSFEIPKGKVISLIGPNGAGKSTVMGMLSRLVTKDSGVINFEEKDLSKWKSKELAKLNDITFYNRCKYLIEECFSSGILKQQFSGKKIYFHFKNIEFLFKI